MYKVIKSSEKDDVPFDDAERDIGNAADSKIIFDERRGDDFVPFSIIKSELLYIQIPQKSPPLVQKTRQYY